LQKLDGKRFIKFSDEACSGVRENEQPRVLERKSSKDRAVQPPANDIPIQRTDELDPLAAGKERGHACHVDTLFGLGGVAEKIEGKPPVCVPRKSFIHVSHASQIQLDVRVLIFTHKIMTYTLRTVPTGVSYAENISVRHPTMLL